MVGSGRKFDGSCGSRREVVDEIPGRLWSLGCCVGFLVARRGGSDRKSIGGPPPARSGRELYDFDLFLIVRGCQDVRALLPGGKRRLFYLEKLQNQTT